MKSAIASLLIAAAALAPVARADPPPYVAVWQPTQPGLANAFVGGLHRIGGSAESLRDFTVAAQFTAQNGAGVHQWAFGLASEAWALPGSRSILVGIESAVINEEPTNAYPKIAVNAVMKNRADDGVDPGAASNANSIAFWVSAQPGTGFERGLVFDRRRARRCPRAAPPRSTCPTFRTIRSDRSTSSASGRTCRCATTRRRGSWCCTWRRRTDSAPAPGPGRARKRGRRPRSLPDGTVRPRSSNRNRRWWSRSGS